MPVPDDDIKEQAHDRHHEGQQAAGHHQHHTGFRTSFGKTMISSDLWRTGRITQMNCFTRAKRAGKGMDGVCPDGDGSAGVGAQKVFGGVSWCGGGAGYMNCATLASAQNRRNPAHLTMKPEILFLILSVSRSINLQTSTLPFLLACSISAHNGCMLPIRVHGVSAVCVCVGGGGGVRGPLR